MPIWIAIALQAGQSGGVSDQRILSVLPRCAPAAGSSDIVVCGRPDHRDDQRLTKLDPRFEQSGPANDGRFTHKLSDSATLSGGGPKGSVGLTLRVGF